MIDIDKTIEGDVVLSIIKDYAASELCIKTYSLAGIYLNFKAGRNKIEVQLLKHKADEKDLADIADFLENKNIKKTVYSILKKIQPICGKIIVDNYAYIEMKEENENNTGLSIETLKQMGYKHPCTVRYIIEAVEQGKDPESINSGLIKSLLTTEGHGHIFHSFILSYTPIFPEKNPSYKADKDNILLIDRKWVPSNNGRLLGKVVEAIRDGKTVEESLECLKEEETAQPKNSEKEAPTPASHDAEGEQIRICIEGSSDEIEVNTTAACDDRLKAEKEEASEPPQRPNNWWTQSINDIEFTQEEFEKAKAKQATKSEAPYDLQCAVSFCKSIFEEKFGLYGASFCDMHPETITDQLFMKATILKKRLTDRDKSERLGFAFFEGVRDEFAAVVNYGVIALRQAGFGVKNGVSPDSPVRYHTCKMQEALSLISDKGADYGELWREQRIGTLADMIYTKIRRIKSIENQYRVGGMTEEGYHKFAGDQYKDLINYGLFGVVRMTEIADVLAFEMEEDESDEEEYE